MFFYINYLLYSENLIKILFENIITNLNSVIFYFLRNNFIKKQSCLWINSLIKNYPIFKPDIYIQTLRKIYFKLFSIHKKERYK